VTVMDGGCARPHQRAACEALAAMLPRARRAAGDLATEVSNLSA